MLIAKYFILWCSYTVITAFTMLTDIPKPAAHSLYLGKLTFTIKLFMSVYLLDNSLGNHLDSYVEHGCQFY